MNHGMIRGHRINESTWAEAEYPSSSQDGNTAASYRGGRLELSAGIVQATTVIRPEPIAQIARGAHHQEAASAMEESTKFGGLRGGALLQLSWSLAFAQDVKLEPVCRGSQRAAREAAGQ